MRRVGEGGSVLDPSVVAQLVGQRRKGDDRLAELSDRELDVLVLMAEGRSNRAIGRRLFISEHTVEKHVNRIFGDTATSSVARGSSTRSSCVG